MKEITRTASLDGLDMDDLALDDMDDLALDLDEPMEGLSWLDELAMSPMAGAVVTPLLGVGLSVGTTAALTYWVKDKTSAFVTYAPLFGAGVGALLGGLASWKIQGKEAALATVVTSALTGLGLWLIPKVQVASVTQPVTTDTSVTTNTPTTGWGTYAVEEPVPVWQGLQAAPEVLSEEPEVVSGYNPAFV